MMSEADQQEFYFPPDRIKRIRLRLGFSHQEFAEYLGYSKAAVISWEMGRHAANRPHLLKLLRDAEKAGLA